MDESPLVTHMPDTQLLTIDWVVIGSYFIVLAAIGLYYRRFAGRSLDEFFLAGRRNSGFANGLSYAAALMNADVAPAYSGFAVATGLFVCWFYLSRFGIALFLGAISPLVTMPAQADAPAEGLVIEGVSVPGVALGDNRAVIEAVWGPPRNCQNVEEIGDRAACSFPVEGGGTALQGTNQLQKGLLPLSLHHDVNAGMLDGLFRQEASVDSAPDHRHVGVVLDCPGGLYSVEYLSAGQRRDPHAQGLACQLVQKMLLPQGINALVDELDLVSLINQQGHRRQR